MGLILFIVDALILIIFFFALRTIIKYYQKDYQINVKFVVFVLTIISLLYLFESFQSDMIKTGNKWFNESDLSNYKGRFADIIDFVHVATSFNSFVQGASILVIFNYFGKKKFEERRKSIRDR